MVHTVISSISRGVYEWPFKITFALSNSSCCFNSELAGSSGAAIGLETPFYTPAAAAAKKGGGVTSFPMESLFTLVMSAAVVVQTNASIASAVGQCSGFEFFNNTNILGHDLPPASGRPKAASAAECCGKCQEFGALCGGFTFDYSRCFLKTRPNFHSDPAARQPFKGAVSALAPNGGSTQLPCGNRSSSSAPPLFPWCDLTSSKDARIGALVANLSIPEKVSLVWSVSVGSSSPAIPRIRWPAIKWWHEDCHGAWVPGDKRPMTTWPAPIGVGASFNRSLFRSLGELTSTEGRARSKTQADYWGPNINIYRDPRWGRGQETPGESPALSASFGVEFTRAMQGADSSARSVTHSPPHSPPVLPN